MKEIKNYKIANADTYKYIKKIPSASIDLILTDPPYNLSPYSTGDIKFNWRKDLNNNVAEWDKKSFVPSDWVEEFKRILKPTGNIFAFCSYNLMGKWHESFDPEFDTFQFMVWHKTNPAPKVRRAGFLNSCELIICVWNKGHTWNFSKQNEMHNFIQTPICMGRERTKEPHHPTQKPVRVLKHIIKLASNPDDLVFDPFMGVGSTGVAAIEMRRRFLGVDADKQYFDGAKKRLSSVQLTSFDDELEIREEKESIPMSSNIDKISGAAVIQMAKWK